MHVTQLLQAFLLTKDDEIVKTTLPHVPFGYRRSPKRLYPDTGLGAKFAQQTMGKVLF